MKSVTTKKQIVEICRANRQKMTEAEAIFWSVVRNRQLDGKKFLRQHKIIYSSSDEGYQFFVLDFFCFEEQLAIELDGGIHEQQVEYDAWRTSVLNEMNIRVLRILNEELFNIEDVKQKIRLQYFPYIPREERGQG